MGSQPSPRRQKPEWQVVVGAIVTVSLKQFGLETLDKPLKKWCLLMKRHWAFSALLVTVFAAVSCHLQRDWDSHWEEKHLEDQNHTITLLASERDGWKRQAGKLDTDLKNAENAYAPWRQLAMDKYPNDPLVILG